MDTILVSVEGESSLLAAFAELRRDVGPKHLLRAVRKGANIMKGMIYAAAPEDKGKLRRNLRVRSRKSKSSVRSGVVINQVGKPDNLRNAFYWYFVEKGHRVRKGSAWGPKTERKQYIRKEGRRFGGYGGAVGNVPAAKFVERPWSAFKHHAVQEVFRVFDRVMDQIARKQQQGIR